MSSQVNNQFCHKVANETELDVQTLNDLDDRLADSDEVATLSAEIAKQLSLATGQPYVVRRTGCVEGVC